MKMRLPLTFVSIGVILMCAHLSGQTSWALKQVADVPSGTEAVGNVVCGDMAHDGLPEFSFWRCHGSQMWTWEFWKYRPVNRYELVKSDTCMGDPYYPGPGMHKGLFLPTDIGDPDGDGLTEILGVNDYYFYDSSGTWDSTGYYLCLYESRDVHSLPDSLVWTYYSWSGADPHAWFPGDMDHDGRKEIVFSCPLHTCIFENRGDNQYDLVDTTAFHYRGFAYAFGDFDQDSLTEYVTARSDQLPDRLLIYKCTGNDRYALTDTFPSVPSLGLYGYDICSGNDLDADGKPEFFVGWARTDGEGDTRFFLYMYEYNGHGYDAIPIDSAGDFHDATSSARHSVCADIDGDGQQELLWSYNRGVKVYKTTAPHQFHCVWSWQNSAPDWPDAHVECYDMNGNGYPDIIISGNDHTWIYEMEAVRILTPNGGEQLRPGDTCRIRWRTFSPPRCDSVSLFLRTDTTWNLDTLIHGLGPGDTAWTWTVPDIRSDYCHVVAIAYGPGWQYDESDTFFHILPLGVEEATAPLVSETKLIGASPNPCAGTMRISFQIGNQGQSTTGQSLISLRICDISGRTAAVLADGVMKPGVYHRDWEVAPTVPNGVYFIRLETPDYRETQKVILTR